MYLFLHVIWDKTSPMHACWDLDACNEWGLDKHKNLVQKHDLLHHNK